MAKKFLLISQVFYPDQVSTANLFTDLCSELSRKNIEVEVWAGQPSYNDLTRQPAEISYNGYKIQYLLSTNIHKSSFAGRILNTLSFTLSASVKLLFSREKTPVWTHTTPPFLGIVLSIICKLKRRKFIYILLDIFPEGLVRLGKLNRKNLFVRVWHYSFIRSLKRSCKIIAIGRDMKSWVLQNYPGGQEKIDYIPHWQNENIIFPVKVNENELFEDFSLQNRFIIQYSGNMGLWNDMASIGKAVDKNIGDDVFLFVGDGIRKKELVNEITKAKTDNVIMLPFQPVERYNDLLAASHIQLVSLREGLEGMAVPCKIYGILASGKPVIALVPKNSEIAMVVEEENCGIVVEPTDSSALLSAIAKLKTDVEYREKLGTNSRKAFEKKYSLKVVSSQYYSLIEQLD